MPAVLASANVVVLPSYREGLPKVLLEAAACGRAIVTSDVPGCREVALEGTNALRVPPMNAPALAAAIRTLVEDPELRKRFGMAGRHLALSEFAVESVVARTIEVYRELLAETALEPETKSARPAAAAESSTPR